MATATTALTPGTTSSATLNSLPDWYEQYGQALTGSGLNMLPGINGYQGAVGPDGQPLQRVAGLDPSQQQATQQVQNMQGQFMPTLQSGIGAAQGGLQQMQAGAGVIGGAQAPLGQMGSTLGGAASYLNPALQSLSAGGQTYNADEAQAYMNPYVNNVVDRIATLGNRNLTENVLPQVNSTFTGAGQFGSTRNADFNLRALRDNQDAVSGAQATALMNAQTEANSQYAAEKQRQLASGQGIGALSTAATGVANGFGNQAQIQGQIGSALTANGQAQGALGTTLGNLATTGQTLGINDNNALLTVGGLNQNTNQKALDAQYQDFLDQRDYPLAALGGLSQILPNVSGRITPNSQSTSVTQGPTADPLQNWSNLVNLINAK
jgi:hypothetical protein